MQVSITKADGTSEPFDVKKLERSLRRSGARAKDVSAVVEYITPRLYEGMKTQEIYREAFAHLRKIEPTSASRYSLRRALFGLGPTGFPFEDFLAKLFALEGYTTKTRLIISGACVQHEIDVAAYKDDDAFLTEAKFHARPGIKSDLQTVMYCYARKLDTAGHKICSDDGCGVKDFYVVTNTKFTHTAERYAECVGLKLLSWDYPKNNNLQDRIQSTGLYPVTVLQSLSNSQKQFLIQNNVIVCREIKKKPKILQQLNLTSKKTDALFSEISQLCKQL